ncbi:MAG: AAA family ATPase [Xanthomonadales bacterium]|nr:AAA family ATPase [Xanthomonadales bacterium]
MKLERLDIRNLAGLDGPVSVRFEPDAINFITGPNASGKSSIVRAVRALLYPELTPGFCHIRARWRVGEQTLECERHGEQVAWLDGSEPAPPPSLPGSESIGAYLISSEDLARLGDTDDHIAAQIRTLLAGGYDLDAVLAEPPLSRPPRPQKRAKELSELARAVVQKQNEYTELQGELDTLDGLQRELEETEHAAGELRACEDALALADAVAARTALENTLIDEFPGGMDRLRGDELTRLDQIEEQIAQRRKELGLTEDALEAAEKRLSASGGVDPQKLEAVQAELADRRDELADIERRIDQHAVALEQALRQRGIAGERFGKLDTEAQPELPLSELENLERQVDRVLDQREKLRSITAELARLHVPRAGAADTPEILRQARDALAEWLEHARISGLEGILWGGLSLAGALAGWRLLGPREIEPFGELILLVGLAVGVPAFMLGQFILRFRYLADARSRYLATDVEPPLGWAEEEVETRLERLEQELESASHRQVQHNHAGELRERLNQERTRLEEARSKLQAVAESLGLKGEVRLETSFLLWARQLHDWQQADVAVARHKQELEHDRSAHAASRKQAADLLERYGFDQVDNLSSRKLAGVLHQLSPRMRTNAELHNEIQAHRNRLGEIEADIEMLQRRHDQVFEQAGLHSGDRDTLIQRIEQHEEWRQLEQQRRDRSLEAARLEQKLEAEKELLKQAREQQREALARRQEDLAEKAQRRDELNRHIATIRTRHEDLVRRRELQSLTGEYELKREALAEDFDQHMLATAGQTLIEDVRIAHQADNEPAALRRAGHWFERFTHHRYRLHFRGERFEAFDARAEESRSLAELSTATRAQLLLAVRLAWIEQAERNREPLPVFMDEVLTTSDPDRYRLVVESVQEIATGGRQMFYLTAQSDEATAWAAWAGDGPQPHTVDMAEVRRGQIEPLELTMPTGERRKREIPEPGDQAPEAWAREAGIGPIRPWLGTGMIEVFHLLHDDLGLAARLMQLELSRLGELSGYLDTNEDGELLDPGERARLERRCNAAALVLDDWRARHHRPVDAGALAAFGQITDTFMPRVLDLLEEVGGHPRALIEGLREGRVSRFRSDTTDALEEWLADKRYLATRPEDTSITAAELSSRTGLSPEEAADLREWIISAIDDSLGSS